MKTKKFIFCIKQTFKKRKTLFNWLLFFISAIIFLSCLNQQPRASETLSKVAALCMAANKLYAESVLERADFGE